MVGQNILRARMAKSTSVERRMAEAQIITEGKKAEYFGAMAKKSISEVNSIPPLQSGYVKPGTGITKVREKVPYKSAPGIADGVLPLFQFRDDPRGNYHLMFHKDASEVMESDTYNHLKIAILQTMGHLKGAFDLSKEQINFLRQIRRAITPEKGYIALWSKLKGNFVRTKLTNQNRGKLFLSEQRPRRKIRSYNLDSFTF